MSSLHPSTLESVRSLRARFPETPFLTLGQTVFWDEPVKAAFCAICETLEREGSIVPGAKIVAGVHDTDYFAKLEGLAIRDAPFVVLRHNDGDTRGLWSAAGEVSALFGAEVVPSHLDFARSGVALGKAARAYSGGLEALLNQETQAPLWRALVHSGERPLIAAEVRLGDIAPALRQQLRFAFRSSLESAGCEPDFETDNGDPCQARAIVRSIWNWVDEHLTQRPDESLSDLYRALIPRLWSLVRGGGVCHLETTTSLELFRFAPDTCGLPRFRFLDVFLNPATRDLAKRCYNDAVRGSGIYALELFGEGALPFDVVIPGLGRGTLRVWDDCVSIETEPETQICRSCHIESVAQLAALLKSRFGEGVVLVGKAVALISMLSAEFLFVFHEKASSYTSRTQGMNAMLRQNGVELELHPMLRLQLNAWDALEEVEARFHLPPHLSGAFGSQTLSAREFARRWRAVAQAGDDLRAQLQTVRAPRALLQFLVERDEKTWRARLAQHEKALAQLQLVREKSDVLRREVAELRQVARADTARSIQVERAKGDWFRAHIAPLKREIADLRQAAMERLNPLDENGKPRKWSKDERAQLAQFEREEEARIEELQSQIETLQVQHRVFDSQIKAPLPKRARVEGGCQRATARATRARTQRRGASGPRHA